MITSREGAARPPVTIRGATPDDTAALQAYLDELPATDRHKRFFGPGDPAAHVAARLRLPTAGGVVLVAVEDDPVGRCVGEAMFVPRGDGTAEFAISVAADRRGGLGTLLFAQLRKEAAAKGLDSLHGDVLPDNVPMLRLLRRHGGVTIEREGREFVSVLVSSASGPPPWPRRDGGPRILVEAPAGQWAGEQRLRAAGFQVAVCAGPTARTADDGCPLLAGRDCPLVSEADAVVQLLPPEGAGGRVHAAVCGAVRPPVPVVAPARGQPGGEVAATLMGRLAENRT